MHRITFGLFALIGIMTVTSAVPQYRDDPYTPIIDFLKQLRQGRKDSIAATATNNRQSEGQLETPTSTPILIPSQSQPSNSQPPSFGSGSTSTANFPQFNRPSSSTPADITRINTGVSTILNGVRTLDLGQILRGAFVFPTNNNVKSVANNVLDSIFGAPGGQPPTQN